MDRICHQNNFPSKNNKVPSKNPHGPRSARAFVYLHGFILFAGYRYLLVVKSKGNFVKNQNQDQKILNARKNTDQIMIRDIVAYGNEKSLSTAYIEECEKEQPVKKEAEHGS